MGCITPWLLMLSASSCKAACSKSRRGWYLPLRSFSRGSWRRPGAAGVLSSIFFWVGSAGVDGDEEMVVALNNTSRSLPKLPFRFRVFKVLSSQPLFSTSLTRPARKTPGRHPGLACWGLGLVVFSLTFYKFSCQCRVGPRSRTVTIVMERR